MEKFDVLVIGSGMAGNTIANRCAAAGLKTVISDYQPYGGTCALRGCDPKKILIGAAEIIDRRNKMSGIGIDGAININWPDLIQYKHEFTSKVPTNLEKGYKRNGVRMIHGKASFEDTNIVRLDNQVIEASKIAIATGARPRGLGIPGSELTIDSSAFLDLKDLPNRLVFIGGGYIAMEFSHLAARAGSEVTVIHRGGRPLEQFDEFVVRQLIQPTEDLGIQLILETEVAAIKRSGDGFEVFAKHLNTGEETSTYADLVVNSSGRVPAIDNLNLDAAGIKFTGKGVAVNEFLQSISNPDVYAAGDTADSPGVPLTPVAVMEGHLVSSNIIKGNLKVADYREMPSAVFTLPTLASVGHSEESAINANIDFSVKSATVPHWYNARRINESTYAYKTLIDKDGGIIGAHIIGPHAEETINLFALAIKGGLKATDMKSLVYAYPSMTSDISSML